MASVAVIAASLTPLSSAVYAVREALHYVREGKMPERILDFIELQSVVGFFEYDETLKRFEGKKNRFGHNYFNKGFNNTISTKHRTIFYIKIIIKFMPAFF